MKKHGKWRRRCAGCLPALVSVLVVLCAPCEATVLQIWPDQLKPTGYSTSYYQLPSELRITDTTKEVDFFAPVSIPVGRTITKMHYYRSAFAANPTTVVLYRVKMGQKPSLVALGYSVAVTNGDIVLVSCALGNAVVVEKDYRYFVRVFIDNQDSDTAVQGIKIVYQ